jgi:hypothetical protein
LPDGVVPPLVCPELWRRANDRLARAIQRARCATWVDPAV